jgi:HEAT repeat protein
MQIGPKAAPAIANAMLLGTPSVQLEAIRTLNVIRDLPIEPVVLNALINGLSSNISSVRSRAATALHKLGQLPIEILPALIAVLDEIEEPIGHTLVKIISLFGSEAVSSLLPLLGHENHVVRQRTAEALHRICPKDDGVVPRLTAALQDNHPWVRWRMAAILGEMGPTAADAAPALVNCLSDVNPIVRRTAADALGNVANGEDVVIALQMALKDLDLDVALSAATAIKSIREKTVPNATGGTI